LPSRPLAWLAAGLSILLAPAPAALAWGPAAHRAAADLAERRLCDAAREEIRSLLGEESLAEASVWPDTIRSDPRWKHTADWHYADIGDDEPIARLHDGSHGRLLTAISEQLAILFDRRAGKTARRQALSFTAHLLVDLHQPLHVGRPADRGGNTVEVRLGERRTSLHQVWDSGLIGLTGLGSRDLSRALEPLAMLAVPGLEGGPEAWAEESRALRPWVYDFDARPRLPRLSRRYQVTGTQLALLRLAQGAVRLEGVLAARWCAGARGDIP
jgi:hypothetical protein